MTSPRPFDGRQLGRFVLVGAVMSIGAALAGVLTLIPAPAPRRRLARRSIALVARGILRALGVARRHRGPVPRGAPRQGAMILANHLSWLDIVAAVASWRCTFVAKREVGTWPIIGTMARALGVVFIDRARKRDLLRAIPALEETLRRGDCVLIFAEGTTTHGIEVLRFRSALVEAAVRADSLVFPLAISGEVTEQASGARASAICWCDDETLVANVWRLSGARALSLTLHVGAPIGATGDRKQRTLRAWHDVVRRFQPTRVRSTIEREPIARPATLTAGRLASAAD